MGGRDPALGAPEAPVTVVQFGAFTSPACKDLAPVARRLIGEHEGTLRWVWKDTLLAGDGALNRELSLLARAAERKLGVPGFWAVHDRIFDTILDRSSGQSMARELGITQEQLENNWDVVNEAHELALGLGVSSIPTLVVNGRPWVGPFDFAGLSRLVEEELEQYRAWTQEEIVGGFWLRTGLAEGDA